MDSSSSAADAEVAVLVADLLSVDRNHTRSLLPKLHRLYCAPAHPSQVPPLKLLRHPKVCSCVSLEQVQHVNSAIVVPSQGMQLRLFGAGTHVSTMTVVSFQMCHACC